MAKRVARGRARLRPVGGGSGGWEQYFSSGGTSGYIDYTYDAMDPGEIHFVSGNSGLTVKGDYSFTYTGKGVSGVVINGLGTVVLKDNHSRYCSDSYHGKGPYLGSAFDTCCFGVVKGPYDEEDGVMIGGMQLDDARLPANSNTFGTILDGSNGFDWTGVLAIGSGALLRNVGTSAGFSGGLFTTNTLQSDSWNPAVEEDKSKMLYVVAGGVAKNVKVVSAITNYERISSSLYRDRAALIVSSGGDGDDAIWTNKGDNFLCGDAGNDRLVGASGGDVLAGGVGDDRMHVGGGDDVFTFCENWGKDTVEQLASGSVTLWFASGTLANWDPESLVYYDSGNRVRVKGVSADKVSLKFGDDGSEEYTTLAGAGAFAEFSSEKIFEEPGKGILASL